MTSSTQKAVLSGIERRRSRRIVFRVPSEAISEHKKYKGFIENFSLEGMLKIIPDVMVLDFLPGMKFELSFQLPAGGEFSLGCEIKWVRHRTNMPFGLKHYVGMEIQNSPEVYAEFVQGLYDTYEEHGTCGKST